MKYIKLYEFFQFTNNVSDEDISEKELTMREICLELEDYGANIHIHHHKGSVGNILVISNLTNISWDMIRECLLRLREYLGDDWRYSERWDSGIPSSGRYDDGGGDWENYEINEKMKKLKTYGIKISYK